MDYFVDVVMKIKNYFYILSWPNYLQGREMKLLNSNFKQLVKKLTVKKLLSPFYAVFMINYSCKLDLLGKLVNFFRLYLWTVLLCFQTQM